MRLYTTFFVAASAALAFASAASAASQGDMNDSKYIAVAKCAGIAEGLGGDVAPFADVLKAQSSTRMGEVLDRADEARADAKRNAATAGQDGKAGYARVLGGTCKSYLSQG
jgi:hypothetical protein